jgi:hypothetical protein
MGGIGSGQRWHYGAADCTDNYRGRLTRDGGNGTGCCRRARLRSAMDAEGEAVANSGRVQPMGQIGRRKPKVQSRDEQDAVPFDDPLRF